MKWCLGELTGRKCQRRREYAENTKTKMYDLDSNNKDIPLHGKPC